jgi:hypothetical protein
MKGWWVERYVILHYMGKIQVNTDKKPREMSWLAPAPDSMMWKAMKSRNVARFIHPNFKDLDSLETKYRDTIVTSKERRRIEKALWPLVDRLIRERRIVGDFGTPPMQDAATLTDLQNRVEEIEMNLSKVIFDFNILHAEAKTRGWPV